MMAEDKILLAARYVEGDLDEAEKADFENRLLKDKELKQHLNDYHEVHETLKMQWADEENNLEFKQTLKGLNQQYFQTETKIFSLKPFVKWTSAIAAVLFVGLMLWSPWKDNPYQEFIENNQMLVVDRGVTTLTDLDRAAAYFNAHQYAAAAPLLAKLHQEKPDDSMISYYYSISLIETGNFAGAKAILLKIYNGESAFKSEAAYALAMWYLKNDQKADAKSWLR
jgi:hypothetical protein